MTNFYNYLLHHNVCPEYAKDILAARSVVVQGQKELIALHNLRRLVPGDFNVACSVLFNGNLAESRGVGNGNWGSNTEDLVGPEKARVILATAITVLGSDEMNQAVFEVEDGFFTKRLNLAELYTLGLEVIDIELPTAKFIAAYDDQKATQKKFNLRPLGKLVCKHWNIPNFEAHDVPKHLRNEILKHVPETFTFWLEHDILERVFIGMKLSAGVRRLEVQGYKEGLWVLDGVANMYCSFYNLILNDLMPRPYKEPRWLIQEAQATEAAAENGGDGLSD
jgi:hypothetical protein